MEVWEISKSLANRIFENAKTQIINDGKDFWRYPDGSGIQNPDRLQVYIMPKINDLKERYNIKALAWGLEEARRDVRFDQPWLYYEFHEWAQGFRDQVAFVTKFIFRTTYYTEDAQRDLQKHEKEEQEQKESKKFQQEDLEKEYRKLRKNLQSLIRRREKAGIKVGIRIPSIPKIITGGSIRRLQSLIDIVKDTYRYLQGRGYRF